MECRLCGCPRTIHYATEVNREYRQCSQCHLIFVPDHHVLLLEDQIKRYALHDNSYENSDYCNYLKGVIKKIERIPLLNKRILDFGCGYDSVLTKLLHKEGFHSTAYDPLYNIGLDCFSQTYDIIILCEVIEHIQDIQKALTCINSCLASEGYLVIQTELYNGLDDFSSWWYIQDPTHINFFSKQSITMLEDVISRSVWHTNDSNFIILH